MPQRSSPGLGSFQPSFLPEHLGQRGPAFPGMPPAPAPTGMCSFYLFQLSPGSSKAERDIGMLEGTLEVGLDWGGGVLRVKSLPRKLRPLTPCHYRSWFLLICSRASGGTLWIAVCWLSQQPGKGVMLTVHSSCSVLGWIPGFLGTAYSHETESISEFGVFPFTERQVPANTGSSLTAIIWTGGETQ